MTTTGARAAAGRLDALTGRALEGLALSGPLVRSVLAVVLAFALASILIVLSGKNPLVAYAALARGAFGSWYRAAVLVHAGSEVFRPRYASITSSLWATSS